MQIASRAVHLRGKEITIRLHLAERRRFQHHDLSEITSLALISSLYVHMISRRYFVKIKSKVVCHILRSEEEWLRINIEYDIQKQKKWIYTPFQRAIIHLADLGSANISSAMNTERWSVTSSFLMAWWYGLIFVHGEELKAQMNKTSDIIWQAE